MRIIKTFKSISILIITAFLFSCNGDLKRLEVENEELKKENVLYKEQLDSLQQQVDQLKWELDAQRRIAAKNAAIAARGKQPIDLSYKED